MTTIFSGKDPKKLQDNELDKALKECIEKRLPQSAEPLFDEAIHRANEANDYIKQQELIVKRIALNCERMEQEDYFFVSIDKYISEAATPLRQMLNLQAANICISQYNQRQRQVKYLLAAIDNQDNGLTNLSADKVVDCDNKEIWGSAFTFLAAKAASQILDFDFYIPNKNFLRFAVDDDDLDNDIFENEDDEEEETVDDDTKVKAGIVDFVNSWRKTIEQSGNELDSVMFQLFSAVQKAKNYEPIDEVLAQMRQNAKSPIAQNALKYAEAYALIIKAQNENNVEASDKLADEACQLLEALEKDKLFSTMVMSAKELISRINNTEAHIEVENLISAETFVPVAIRYRNIDEVELRFYKNTPNFDRFDGAKKVLQKAKPIRTERITLPKIHRRIDCNTAYYESEGLPIGKYIAALFDTKGELLTTYGFAVSNVRGVTVESASCQSVMALSAINGKPLLKAKINGKKVDEMGCITLTDCNKIEIDNEGDRLDVNQYYRTRDIKPDEKRSALVLTDRKIYRPEQTIHYEVIAYKASIAGRETLKNNKLRIRLQAYNGTELGQQTISTNEFGSAAGTFEIPADVPLGMATIEVFDLDNHTNLQHFSFRIEEYKRRDNNLTFSPITDMLVPGDVVKLQAQATDASGLPLAGCNVECLLINSYSNEIKTLDTLTTDANGQIEIEVPTSKESGPFDFRIRCKLTDPKGETLEASTKVVVMNVGYSLHTGSNTKIAEGEDITAYLSCKTLNDAPYKSNIKVELFSLDGKGELFAKAKFDSYYFDNDRFDTILGNRLNQDVNKKLSKTEHKALLSSETVEVDGHINHKLRTAKLVPGRYAVRYTGNFANGEKYEKEDQFVVYSVTDKASSGLDLLMINAPNNIDAGQKAKVRVGTGLTDQTITISFACGDKLTQRQLTLSGEMRTVEFDVPANTQASSVRISITAVRNNRFYQKEASISINRPQPKAEVRIVTKRDLSQPGSKEVWTLSTDASEVVASMYDARLDKFVNNTWDKYLTDVQVYTSLSVRYISHEYYLYKFRSDGRAMSFQRLDKDVLKSTFFNNRDDFYVFYNYGRFYNSVITTNSAMRTRSMALGGSAKMMKSMAAPMAMADMDDMVLEEATMPVLESEAMEIGGIAEEENEPAPRIDFRETVFFAPQMKPDSAGNVEVSFELPDNITTYIFRARAHKNDMAFADANAELVVRKPLSISGGWPRFLRADDKITIAATVTADDKNISQAECTLEVKDKVTGRNIGSYQPKTAVFAQAKQQKITWKITVPQNVDEVEVKMSARTKGFADVEQKTLPILPSAVEVDESQTFALMNTGVHNIKNPYNDPHTKQLTFSYTANTFMHVLRALPSLDKSWSESADTYVGRIESNSLAILLAQNADLKKASQNLESLGDAISNAEPTPWRQLALSLKQHDKDVATMLQPERTTEQLSEALVKLAKLQGSDGGIRWFDGMDKSPYLTAYVVRKFGELQRLGLLNDKRADDIVSKARKYVISNLKREYKEAKRHKNHEQFGLWHADDLLGLALTRKTDDFDKEIEEMIDQAATNWPKTSTFNLITVGRLMLSLGKTQIATEIAESLRQNLVRKDDVAHVSETVTRGWSRPLMANAELIMFFNSINSAADQRDIRLLTNWLVLQKRGDYWPDREVTSRAVLALLGTGKSFAHTDIVSVAGERIALTVEKPHMALPIADHSTTEAVIEKTGEMPSWGAWTRVNATPITEMKAADCNELSIERKLFVRRGAAYKEVKAGTPLHVGDVLKVELNLKVGSNLSFVEITDYRASAQEPVDFLSSYRGFCWWGGGIPHYFSPADTRATFYVYDLLRGTHTFAYETTITQSGTLTAGYAEAKCLFDPDIVAHSSGKELKVE